MKILELHSIIFAVTLLILKIISISSINPPASSSIRKQTFHEIEFTETNNENNSDRSSLSLRRNDVDNNISRRLNWWLLFWNALHPGPPCPPKCVEYGNCPPHCHGGGSSGSDSSSSSSSSSGDSSSSSSGGSNGDSSYYNDMYDDMYDDGQGRDGSAEYYSGAVNYYNEDDAFNSGSTSSSIVHETSTEDSSTAANNIDPSKGYIALACAGLAAVVALVAIAIGQQRGEAVKPHPLQGSLGRRMMLFSGLANKSVLSANRPERVVEMAENESSVDYVRA